MRADLADWFATPVNQSSRPRDELAIKLALALTTPGVDTGAILRSQRTATMRTLQEYTRLKSSADKPADLPWRLVVEAMLFQAEAEIRWLDHCETSLVRHTPASVETAAHDTAGPAAAPAAADQAATGQMTEGVRR